MITGKNHRQATYRADQISSRLLWVFVGAIEYSDQRKIYIPGQIVTCKGRLDGFRAITVHAGWMVVPRSREDEQMVALSSLIMRYSTSLSHFWFPCIYLRCNSVIGLERSSGTCQVLMPWLQNGVREAIAERNYIQRTAFQGGDKFCITLSSVGGWRRI